MIKSVSGTAIFLSLVIFFGCSEDKNSVGLSGSKQEPQYQRFRKVPTSFETRLKKAPAGRSNVLYVGNFKGYETRSVLKFSSFSPKDSIITGVKLKLYTSDLIYDSLQATSFDISIHKVTEKWNDSVNVKWDDITGKFDTKSLDTKTLSVSKSDSVIFNLSALQDTIQNWANGKNATNYGLFLNFSSGANFIKAFNSTEASSKKPSLEITYKIKSKERNDTTITTIPQIDSYIIKDTQQFPQKSDRIYVFDGGLSAVALLKFDLSTVIPENSTVNNAKLILTLDKTDSFFDKNTTFGFTTDRITSQWVQGEDPKLAGIEGFGLKRQNSDTLVAEIKETNVTHWINNSEQNKGIALFLNIPTLLKLSRFSFYINPNDSTLWPRFEIYYTVPSVKP